MARMQPILLDLNIPTFQEQLFALDTTEVVAVFAAFKKLKKLEWPALHKHKGFHWEDAGLTTTAPNGATIKSIRITYKVRALAYREGDFMRFLSLHFDHDSAYR